MGWPLLVDNAIPIGCLRLKLLVGPSLSCGHRLESRLFELMGWSTLVLNPTVSKQWLAPSRLPIERALVIGSFIWLELYGLLSDT